MDKRDFFLFLLLACTVGTVNKSLAQSSASASQRVELQIRPRIEFSSFNQGVANAQEFKLRSNSNVVVKVSTGSSSKQSAENNMFFGRGEQVFAMNTTTGNKLRKTSPAATAGIVYTATEP